MTEEHNLYQLFQTKYLAKDERDLAEYILKSVPFAKENVGIFEESWISYILDMDLTPQQKARIHNFSLINGNRRRQELQAGNPGLKPSYKEMNRRAYLSRGEHLKTKI